MLRKYLKNSTFSSRFWSIY